MPAPPESYTLSLHDALPICREGRAAPARAPAVPHQHAAAGGREAARLLGGGHDADRKSTRLNSSHQIISYAVFCLKKKKKMSGSKTSPDRRRSVRSR